MKKIFVLLSAIAIMFVACNDDDDDLNYEEQLALDIENIQTYLADSNLTAQSTATGLHYIIEEEGNGSFPTTDSIVEVKYVGTFLNGEEFDGGTIEGPLYTFILGWQEGIPFFSEGGKGKLLVPSSLGYGIYDWYGIPGRSVLIFDIELLNVED